MSEKMSLQQWIREAEEQGVSLSDYCLSMHAIEMEISSEEILMKMQDMLEVMKASAAAGLEGKPSLGGLVGDNAKQMKIYLQQGSDVSLMGPLASDTMVLALSVGEANSSMGRIVAAPTAGFSGILPGILLAMGKHRGFTDERLAKGLAIAGAIGMVIASRASLSGAEGGCQAECGSAAAMAAGAAVDLMGGNPGQVGQAVALVLKNMLGLVCDPVAGLVEVPCVKRNAGAAVQALAAADMALAGIRSVIPVDEVIDAMAAVGRALPCSLKETAQGGLAATPTGLSWSRILAGE